MSRRPNKTKPRNSQSIVLTCSRCRQNTQVVRREIIRAARQRCPACGGPLNKPTQA